MVPDHESAGTGPPLVLLPAGTCDSRRYERLDAHEALPERVEPDPFGPAGPGYASSFARLRSGS